MPLSFDNIEIRNEYIHSLLNGKKLLIIHGDQFDGFLSKFKWLSHIGAIAYDILLYLNNNYNKMRSLLGYDYWSLSHYLKLKTKELHILIKILKYGLNHLIIE